MNMLITNVRLIPELSGGVAADNASVFIENGLISAVHTSAPEGYDDDVFDGKGMTLIPGLIDAHTHIAGLRNYSRSDLNDPMQYFTKACMLAKRYLDYGFTTIRDCGTALRVNSAVRDAIDSGLFTGPHIISCGRIIEPTEESENSEIREMYVCVDSPDEARKAVRAELAEQADFIKIMASGSALDRHGIPDQPIMTEDECRTIVETAKMKKSYVAAHAHGDGAIRMCAELGVRTIEHASFISEKTVEVLLAKENCWLIPTVSAMYQNPETTSPEYMFLVKKLADMMELSSVCLNRAYKAGVKMGFGTDSCPGMDQYERGLEFSLRRDVFGFYDLDILLQATKYSAEALGIDDKTGEIKPGLRADLVLVDGKPDEDIKALCKKPAAVFVSGRLV